MSSQPISRRYAHFIGIFLIAFAVLAYQVLLTRIFSVMLYYHYAFAGISLAMLGLTLGAQKVYLEDKRFSPGRLEEEWTKAALGFSVSCTILMLAFLYAPLVLVFRFCLVFFLFLFIIPFVYAGICVTLVLTKSSASVGRLYAADLAGAALGCMGVAGILFVLDPVTVVFGLSMLIAFAASLMIRKPVRLKRIARILTALAAVFFTVHGVLYLTNGPHFDVVWAKGKNRNLENVLFERWNAFSLVRVTPEEKRPFGWGFGRPPPLSGPDQLALSIDAQAGTVITQFDGKNLKPFDYLAGDVINAAYHLRQPGEIAVIGVGGGRDILSALFFGAQHVTGIELNPSIFEALVRRFGDFSGHLDRRPDVALANAEARSWLNHSSQSFDLIQISLIDTWAATAASGLTLSENKLYTLDAWQDFFNRLTPHGILSVSRWFDPQMHKGEFYRLLSLAAETLKQEGVPATEIRQHILALGTDGMHVLKDYSPPGVVTVMISRSPYGAQELQAVKDTATIYGFHLMATPDASWDDVSQTILSGAADKTFYDSLPIDVSAPTDNRPFFFHMVRLRDLLHNGGKITDEVNGGSENYAIIIVLALLLVTLLFMIYFVIIPLLETWKSIPDKGGVFPHLGYFGGIGLGFMLIEISQMQRLMVFLGHPVYGLTVVLFTLLLFGGLGSAVAAARGRTGDIVKKSGPAVVCIVLTAVGLATPLLSQQLKICGVLTRILASVALLAPAGICMGIMFPLGMAASARYRALQPWFWGLNGSTSVVGSILGVLISMECGIAAAFWTGVGCYVICAILSFGNVRNARPSRRREA